jgi:hypothetical protein
MEYCKTKFEQMKYADNDSFKRCKSFKKLLLYKQHMKESKTKC